MANSVVHGGVSDEEWATYAARGISLVDLSANLNPYGPLRRIVEAARSATLERYPEPDAATLRRAYAASAGVAPPQVLAGNGSTEIFYLIARAFLDPGARCLIAGPSFGEYAAAARAANATVEICDAMHTDGSVDMRRLLRVIEQQRPVLVFLCNPNNPTGAFLESGEIDEMKRAVRTAGGRLVVDEAYIDFACRQVPRSRPGPGCMVVRSLTKLHAIPGLRVGFLLGEADDVERVAFQQPSWAVSAPAIAAALAAIEEGAFAAESAQWVMDTRSWLIARLRSNGFAVSDSRANFVLVEVDDAPAFRAHLLEEGFVVRDCTSFGLPRHVRIGVPAPAKAQALAEALQRVRR